jgi:hypothetical protein
VRENSHNRSHAASRRVAAIAKTRHKTRKAECRLASLSHPYSASRTIGTILPAGNYNEGESGCEKGDGEHLPNPRIRQESWLVKRSLLFAACSLLLTIHNAPAQFGSRGATNRATTSPEEASSDAGIQLGEQLTQRWKVGMIIKAPAAPCVGVYGTATVPTDWPEQQVRLIEEDLSPEVRDLEYRTLANGVKQMLVTIPRIEAGDTAHALVTLEVTRSAILAPPDPEQMVVPARLSRDLRYFLGDSPYIETGNPRIRSLARQLVRDQETAWDKVETLYDWVRDNVEYRDGALKGAAAALKDGFGDCEELSSLFIAFCRANQIPARTVWVPGHCYPEFYLEDQQGQGHWIPCQAAGTRDFGSMPDHRPILQKGDKFRVPEKREEQRYVAEFLKVKTVRIGKPDVKFVRQLLPGE